MRFETRAIHDGQSPDPATGAVNVPIYQTSTYRQDAVGHHRGYEYSRTGNPTRTPLEQVIASLEGARYGLAFSSGLAATDAVMNLLEAGDHVVSGEDIYGGTYRLFEKVYRKWGVATTYADATDPLRLRESIRDNTRLIWIETPTNPLLKITDIAAMAEIAREKKIMLAVDNTFATPYLQNPLALGADIVVHSTTKYLGGHSDLIGGAVVTADERIYDELKFHQNAAGAVPGPMDCYLALRGVKTLSLRMREHGENALYLAEFLEKHPVIARVHYPGLAGHPQHALATRQMRGFGGMVSVELDGGEEAVRRFLSKLKLFFLAESLGGVESLVTYPWAMTHGSIPRKERERRGIGKNLLRLSVGIENRRDLRDDLERALA